MTSEGSVPGGRPGDETAPPAAVWATGYPGLPEVKRARGYRLYTEAGRFLDLWQAAGGAIYGHSPTGLARELKAQIDRGLLGPVPNRQSHRLAGALATLFPGWAFTPYLGLSRALHSLAAGPGEAPASFVDPGLSPSGPASRSGRGPGRGPGAPNTDRPRCLLWRPYLGDLSTDAEIIIPILPGMHATPVVLVGRLGGLGSGDTPGHLDLAILTHGALLLAGRLPEAPQRPKNEISPWAQEWPRLEPVWSRKGPYLTPRCTKGEYDAVFKMYLKNGFYVAPAFPGPSILPASCSSGEWEGFLRATDEIGRELRL